MQGLCHDGFHCGQTSSYARKCDQAIIYRGQEQGCPQDDSVSMYVQYIMHSVHGHILCVPNTKDEALIHGREKTNSAEEGQHTYISYMYIYVYHEEEQADAPYTVHTICPVHG